MRLRTTWDGGIVNADIRLLENLVWCGHHIHAISIANMSTPTAVKRFNESNGTHVVDLVEIVLCGDAPSPPSDGKIDL